MVEWLNYRHGRQVFLGYPLRFLRICWISTVLWFVFEIYNLYLGNWYYVGVPADRLMRWGGTFVSFSTVLPGLWVTQRFLYDSLPDSLSHRPSLSLPEFIDPLVITAGLVGSVGPLIQPELLYPLVWGGLLFVADGIAYRCNWRSFRGQWESGDLKPVVSWLLSGAICGLLWEFWNVQATAGWIYTVPGMGEWRLFEMPLLGYLGFPPFALMVRRLHTVYEDGPWNRSWISGVGMFLFSGLLILLTLVAMDRYTFVSYKIEPMKFIGWTQQERQIYQQQEKSIGKRWENYFPLKSSKRKIKLLRFASMGTRSANCLWKNGVRSVQMIENKTSSQLVDIMVGCRAGYRPFWQRRVTDWKQRF